jgi:predicted AlkP superfamily phosphohydrolase/phosphomutase
LKSLLRSTVAKVAGQAVWIRASYRRKEARETRGQNVLTGVTWDWRRSKTWLGAVMEYGVQINSRRYRGPEGLVTGDEYEEVRATIVEGLRGLGDPVSGGPIFDRVSRREDLYSGAFVKRAPDVLFLPRRHVMHSISPGRGGREADGWLVPASGLVMQAGHDKNGVFAATGAAFRTGDLPRMGILDVLPTLLYAMGLPVRADLEGEVARDAFTPEYLASCRVERVQETEKASPAPSAGDAYTQEDEEAIRKQLEELGYL